MKIGVDVSPSLAAILARELAKGEKAVTVSFRQAGEALKADWRADITRAGLGVRLSKTIRSESFPTKGISINAAALVWSNAPVIVGAHDKGVMIRARDGFWLAIPTQDAGKSWRGGRITPAEWEQRRGMKLRFVGRRGKPGLLVADNMRARTGKRGGFAAASKSALRTGRGLVTVPIFILVPQVKLAKRLDLLRSALRAQAGIPSAIVRNWLEDA